MHIMPLSIFFFFLLFHQFADDEDLIVFLQTSLFLVFPYAVDNCMSLSSKSSLTLSIHRFLCLSLLLSPLTCPCSVAFGSLFPSILSACPNHVGPKSSSFNLLYHRFPPLQVLLLSSHFQVFSFESTRRAKTARAAIFRRAIVGPCAVM